MSDAEQQRPEDKFKTSEVIAALYEAKGVKSGAARILGCRWVTVHNYCRRYPSVQKALEQAGKELDDIARGNLAGSIMRGNIEDSKWWLARRQSHEFGGHQTVQHTGPDGGPIRHESNIDINAEVLQHAIQSLLSANVLDAEDVEVTTNGHTPEA